MVNGAMTDGAGNRIADDARDAAAGEAGNAIVEFLVLGLLLLVPLVYVMLAALTLQGASYGVTAAAREAGRAFVTAPSAEAGFGRACSAASLALNDEGVPHFDCTRQLSITCLSGDDCARNLVPGSTIRVVVHVRAELPGLPASLFGTPLGIEVSARHDEVVDMFAEPR